MIYVNNINNIIIVKVMVLVMHTTNMIVKCPVMKKKFTYGEYNNFFDISPKFTWKDYNEYIYIKSAMEKENTSIYSMEFSNLLVNGNIY